MDKKRSSEQIDGELQELRGKLRVLEAEKQQHGKALERAKSDRKKSAYAAYNDKDAKAQERLAKARASQREAELALEDFENALSEGRARFAKLEAEWKEALNRETWAALMVEADAAQKEASLIDQAADALATLMGQHGKRIDLLKRHSHNLGVERAFATMGLRHAERVFAWKMIQAGFASEYEKPSEQYREASGYSAIFAEQVAAAKAIYEAHLKERDATAAEPESEAGAGAGAGA